MKIIDANMYWLPEELFQSNELLDAFLMEMPVEYGTNGYVKADEATGLKQIVIEKPRGYQNLNYMQGEYRVEKQLADMDAAGVEQAVLKLPGCHEWLSLATCKAFNDAMAAHAKESGGRLHPLAVVPPRGTKACLEELARCREQLGMRGVQLCAHYGSLYLDDEAFAPFFARLDELGITAYVHHTPVPVQHDALYEYNNLRRSYGRCVDQMTSLGRVLFSGFFERYPNLRMVYSMLGGGFFAYAGLMLPHAPKGGDTVERFENGNASIAKALAENVYFEMSHAQPWGKRQLECAIEVLGAEHILFGTSYPVRAEWLAAGPAFVQALDVSTQQKQDMLYNNAKKLYC